MMISFSIAPKERTFGGGASRTCKSIELAAVELDTISSPLDITISPVTLAAIVIGGGAAVVVGTIAMTLCGGSAFMMSAPPPLLVAPGGDVGGDDEERRGVTPGGTVDEDDDDKGAIAGCFGAGGLVLLPSRLGVRGTSLGFNFRGDEDPGLDDD